MAAPWKDLSALRELPEEELVLLMGLAGLGLPATNACLALALAQVGAGPANPRRVQDLLARLKGRELVVERRSFWHCAEAALESAARLAQGRGLLRRLYGAHLPPGGMVPDGAMRSRAELRLAFLEGDPARWLPLRERFASQFLAATRGRDPLALVCGGPFEPSWFEALPAPAQALASHALLQDHVLHNLPDPAYLAWMEARGLAGPALPAIEYLLLQGRAAEARAGLEAQDPRTREHFAFAALEGLAALAEGRPAQAVAHYGRALATLRRAIKRKNACLPGLHDPFHILALLATGEADNLGLARERIAGLVRAEGSHPLQGLAEVLTQLAAQLAGLRPRAAQRPPNLSPLGLVLAAVASHLGCASTPPDLPERALRACAPLPFAWFAAEMAELNRRLRGEPPRPSPLLDLVPREEAWERALDGLARLGAPAPGQTGRLAWFIKPLGPGAFAVQVREQKPDAKGAWGRGRALSLRQLREDVRLGAQDRRAVAALQGGGSDLSFDVNGAEALAALVGHPCVFWEGPEGFGPTDLLEGKPELRVRRRGDALELRLEPDPGRGDVLALAEGPRRHRVFVFGEQHRKVRELLGDRLVVPASAQERVLKSLAAVAPLVDIHSDVGMGREASARAGLERVEGLPGPALLLAPAGEGLRIQVRVRPVAGGPALLPGQGGSSLVVEQDGRRLLVERDLDGEAREARDLLAALPMLGENEAFTWSLADPEACLELLVQAEALKARIPVVWAEGRSLPAPRAVGLESLRLKAANAGGWLDLQGEVRVDGARVLDLKALLAHLESTSSRFVPLGDGTFLALSRAFRRRLLDLNALGELRGQRLRLHPGAAALLGDLSQGLESFQGDAAFQAEAARVRAAMALEPALPAGLEAELRGYQEEGFRWMMRLAEAGLGACLADDMGLGKTLQALALLLARGSGPALVVAPTSVCGNWMQEAARFAPTLRFLDLASGDRGALLAQAGPMDVVVASYGLLHQESERLAGIAWTTVILDEAQAIKNALTRRSRAAMALRADFRLVLSGTPVENHLGELWNILRFLNPGLLGSLERFQRRFQIPIERDRDPEALRRLKRLTDPFLLRRTKAQVLEELPPRTEITLHVEPSQAEAAFLEALRQRSLEELEGEGQAIQVLAAIMRLRRACCHPDLVHPGSGIPSSKADAFLELLAHMRENRHRALVFSQFVDHLALLRAALTQRGVPHLYLDGSTPARARAAAVAAFQRGEGEVFLISLKAGGTGLNLTGADYVIHMDPWWNPAVEDQASDRAHRIGQTRPVTIYRLVLRDSIEARIVDLHARKRQLAEELLEGTGAPARLDTETLLSLLRD